LIFGAVKSEPADWHQLSRRRLSNENRGPPAEFSLFFGWFTSRTT
jgi:hypothetical protein